MDIFDDSPARRERLGVARIGRPVESVEPPRIAYVARIGATRAVLTAAIAFAGALANGFPLWAVVVFPPAFVGVQCIARPAGARWVIWSALLAAYASESMVAFAWSSRFVVLLMFFTPLVSYAGSILRGLEP